MVAVRVCLPVTCNNEDSGGKRERKNERKRKKERKRERKNVTQKENGKTDIKCS